MAVILTLNHYPDATILGQFVEFCLVDAFPSHYLVKWCSMVNVYVLAYGHYCMGVPLHAALRHAQMNILFSFCAAVNSTWAYFYDLNLVVANLALMLGATSFYLIYLIELVVCFFYDYQSKFFA